MQFQKLQRTIDYEFKNHDLLVEALTHPSIAHERGTESNHHNQRLEFLGDAVLQLVLTDRIYKLYPEHPEGKLTHAYESLLGAIYLDGGIRAARKFILAQFTEEFSNIKQTTPRQNPKGRL